MDDLHRIGKELQSQTVIQLSDLRHFLEKDLVDTIGPTSLCAIELALLDSWSKEYQINLLEALGGRQQDTQRYSGVIPLMPLDRLPGFLKKISAFDFPSLKLKIDHRLEANLARIRAIRDHYSSEVPIRVDANCSLGPKEAREQIPVLPGSWHLFF